VEWKTFDCAIFTGVMPWRCFSNQFTPAQNKSAYRPGGVKCQAG
jgi:hypothetical protein